MDTGEQQINETHPDKEGRLASVLGCEQSTHHHHQSGVDAKHGNQ